VSSGKSEYQVIVEENVAVPMRDRVCLVADIYHPARDGKILGERVPALLKRTPYGKRDPEYQERARFFASQGYGVVVQDCRGCHGSGGTFYFLAQEPEDGYDTVEWIAEQPWCNGRVGTFGYSYMAWVQSALATQNPPHLVCMFPNMGGWNAFTSSVRQGGAMELRWLAWAFWHSALNRQKDLKKDPWVDRALNRCDVREWLARLPIRKGQTPLSLVPSYEKWLFDLVSHEEYDEFWKQPGFAIEEFVKEHAEVPVYLCGGWYDSYTRATLEAFGALTREKRRATVKLIVGPWTHGTYTTELSYSGDVDFGPEAALPSLDGLHLRWFDRWLRDMDNGIDKSPPVRIFVMGGGTGRRTGEGRLDHGGRWRDEREWPLARTRYVRLHLHMDGTLRHEAPEAECSSTSYLFDPGNPVPTIGGNFSSLDYLLPPPAEVDPRILPVSARTTPITPAGGFDQREGPLFFGCSAPYLPLSSRQDVLVFQSEPLREDVEITGEIEVRLWISSSGRDTDFTAKIIDVYPPNEDYPEGYALNISDTILRARFRNSWSRAEPLEPGEVYPLRLVLYPTSNLFKRGHRIRLDISSSNFPRFDVNPNTGEPVWSSRGGVVVRNSIYHDRERPSHIVLPLAEGPESL